MLKVLCLVSVALVACTGYQEKKIALAETYFTKEDSLTDRYLVLQDSMLQTWNLMMNDDNQKIKSMHFLLHELAIAKQISAEQIETLKHRMAQLVRIRYTQKTMANVDVVEEYDFATNSLVAELVALATAVPNFEQNPTLQGLAEEISMADQRVYIYRADYDVIADRYNEFLHQHKTLIKSIDESCSLEKKPLFDMLVEE